MKKSLLRLIIAAFLFLGAGQIVNAQFTVNFQSPTEWAETYCYVWGPNDYLGGWPGTLMTEEADGWYSISDDTLSAGNFIFNNGAGDGAEQTVNQYLTTGTYCFIPTGGYVGTEVEIEEIACETSIEHRHLEGKTVFNIYPNPADDILQINSVTKIDRVLVHSISGAQLIDLANFSEYGTINIADLKVGLYFITVTFEDGKIASQKLMRQ